MLQNSEHTKSHKIVHFKWVNCMISELYLKLLFKKKQTQKTRTMLQKKPLKILTDYIIIILLLSISQHIVVHH